MKHLILSLSSILIFFKHLKKTFGLNCISIRLISLFILFSLSEITAQTPDIWQYTDIEGLPSMNIYNIAQDKDGLIWLGTEDGICYFDGNRFTVLDASNMKNKDFIGMTQTQEGILFFWNWAGQLFQIVNKKPIQVLPDSLNISVLDVLSYKPNQLIIKARNPYNNMLYICSIKDKQAIPTSDVSPYGFQVFLDTFVQNNPKKNLHITINYFLSKSFFMHQEEKTTVKEFGHLIYSQQWGWLYKDIGSSQLHLLKKGKQDQTKPLLEVPNSSVIRTFYEDNRNNMWVLTNNQLYQFDHTATLKNTYLPTLNKSTVNTFLQDHNGGYWIGTNGEGLYYIPNYDFRTYNSSNINISTNNIINLIAGEKQHSILAATTTGQVIEFDSLNQINTIHQLSGGLKSLYRTYDKKGYWGNFQKGTYYLNNQFAITSSRYDWDGVKSIYEISDTALYLGTSHLALKYTRKTNQSTYEKVHYIHPNIQNLLFEKTYAFKRYKEEILIGGLNGLSIFHKKDSIARPFLIEKGGSLQDIWIQDILVDAQDRIWLATQNSGIYLLDGHDIIQHWKVGSGILSNNCNTLINYDGKIWFRSTKGVHSINLTDYSIRTVSRSDGLPSNIISSLYINDYNSNIYIGTPSGLTIFDVTQIKKEKKPMPVILTGISIANKDTTIQNYYHLDYSNNTIQINFTISNFPKDDIVYFYRLKGLDDNWAQTNSKELRFPKLPAGSYLFEIYAKNIHGEKSIINNDLKLVILRPYWQTWWYYLLIVLSGIGIIAGLTYQIFKRLRRRKEQRLRFQNQIMSSRLQALQSQMNPHFIFNALNAIQHFFTIGDKERAILHLNKFAKLIRLIFEYSKENFISLEKEIKFLDLYLKLEKLRFNDKIEIQLEIDPDIDLENHFVPPLLIQPMIENAFKHGLLHKEAGGVLKIQFKKIEKKDIYCKIEDNGIGRKAAQQLNQWRPSEYRSSGVKNTKERIALINQDEQSLSIKMNITDKENETKEAIGTLVEFYFYFTEEQILNND